MKTVLRTSMITAAFALSVAGSAMAQSTALDFPQTNMDIGDTGMTMTEGGYSIFMDENDAERSPDDVMAMFEDASAEDQDVARAVCDDSANRAQAGYSDNVKDACKLIQPE